MKIKCFFSILSPKNWNFTFFLRLPIYNFMNGTIFPFHSPCFQVKENCKGLLSNIVSEKMSPWATGLMLRLLDSFQIIRWSTAPQSWVPKSPDYRHKYKKMQLDVVVSPPASGFDYCKHVVCIHMWNPLGSYNKQLKRYDFFSSEFW